MQENKNSKTKHPVDNFIEHTAVTIVPLIYGHYSSMSLGG